MNIAKAVDVKAVSEYARGLDGVVYAVDYEFLCSEEGQKLVREAIESHGLNRVVVASCSPKLHEPTFRKLIQEAGLNPFLLEVANIREQCSWPHYHEPEKATEKARLLVKAAVERAKQLEEIGFMKVDITPSALVIGGGLAGVQAALAIADLGFETHLIEKSPSLGGQAAKLASTFPTEDCGVCTPPSLGETHRKCLYRSSIRESPNLKVYTNAELEDFTGHIGSFKVRIKVNPRYVDPSVCVACGKCEAVCPVEVSNEFNEGLNHRKAIYIPFMQCIPHAYVVDGKACTRCGKCVDVCPVNAVNLDEKPVKVELTVGCVIVATGFQEFKPKGLHGYGVYPDVVTQSQLARMLDPTGPTGGKLLRPSDSKPPRRILMVQCVGSRDPKHHPYCGKICCMIALKHAKQIMVNHPEIEVTLCYEDLRLAGKGYEQYLEECKRLGVKFLRGKVEEVKGNGEGSTAFVTMVNGGSVILNPDLVVLSAALTPRMDVETLARTMKLTLSPDGFFSELHPKLAPVDTRIDGVYICGACQGPKDIPESVTQAAAAAARAATLLMKGAVEVDLAKAQVDEELCIACGACIALCPYNAVELKEGKAHVIEAACKGCGICTAECPEGAMQLRHFKDNQIAAVVEAVLGG